MNENHVPEKKGKKKSLLARLLEKLDKKMEEKSKCGCCCSDKDKPKGPPCC